MLKAVKYELSEVPQSYWDFVRKYGTLYQSKPYLEYYAASGNPSFVIVVHDNDTIVGGSGITVRRQALGFPLTAQTYFGPVTADKLLFTAVIKSIAEFMKKRTMVFSIVVHPDFTNFIEEDDELSRWARIPQTFLFWDISGSPESLWKQLPKGKQAAINRARREGVILQEIDTIEHVRQFQTVYAKSQIRGGRTPTPQRYFENMITIMKPQGLATGFIALHPQTRQPIAGVMMQLSWYGTASYFSVGYDYEFRQLGVTDFLMWSCLEYLKTRGFSTFDLMGLPQGDSERAKGIRHFKTAWAGDNGQIKNTYTISRGVFGLNPLYLKNIVNGLKKPLALLRKKHGE